jgi:hypothetical protein
MRKTIAPSVAQHKTSDVRIGGVTRQAKADNAMGPTANRLEGY